MRNPPTRVRLLTGRPYTLSPHDSGLLIEDVWPAIFFGRERVGEIECKITRLTWAKGVWEQMKAEAERVLNDPPRCRSNE